jgi:hypothetical protein
MPAHRRERAARFASARVPRVWHLRAGVAAGTSNPTASTWRGSSARPRTRGAEMRVAARNGRSTRRSDQVVTDSSPASDTMARLAAPIRDARSWDACPRSSSAVRSAERAQPSPTARATSPAHLSTWASGAAGVRDGRRVCRFWFRFDGARPGPRARIRGGVTPGGAACRRTTVRD